MANPRAFISFDFDNNEKQKIYFIGQAINSRTPFSIEDWSSKTELAQYNWEQIIEAKMKKSNMMIVLVGRSMSTATGVHREIEMARKNNVPFLEYMWTAPVLHLPYHPDYREIGLFPGLGKVLPGRLLK